MIMLSLLLLSFVAFATLVVPDQGEGYLADAFLGKTNMTTLTLRLYTNNYSPIHTTTEANVTEASGGGYAAIALTASSWSTTPGSPTSSTYPQQTFTFTGPLSGSATIYGYYITRGDGKLVWAEKFTTGFQPANNGDSLAVTLAITTASVSND